MMAKCHIEQIGDEEVLVACGNGHWRMPDWAEYKYIDFGTPEDVICTFKICARGSGKVTLKVDGNEEISSAEIDNGDFEYVSVPCRNTSGIRALWLFLEGELTIKEFLFE